MEGLFFRIAEWFWGAHIPSLSYIMTGALKSLEHFYLNSTFLVAYDILLGSQQAPCRTPVLYNC